ncbi:MAG: divergent polysaccharide deacetylase family protein [Rhodospirillales bacterium]
MSSRAWNAATALVIGGAIVASGLFLFAPIKARSIRSAADLPPPVAETSAPARPAEIATQPEPVSEPASAPAPGLPATETAVVIPPLAVQEMSEPPLAPPVALAPAKPAGAPAWIRNAVPFERRDSRPLVSIVIDDVGLNSARTSQVAALKGPITIAFLPYSDNLPDQASKVRAAGHETIVHVPMEPSAQEDPGPNALLVRLPEQELKRRLDWALKRFDGFVGFNNHMGSRFTANAARMELVAEAARERGLLFLDSVTSADSVAFQVVSNRGVPAARRDVFLDNDSSFEPILVQLDRVEKVARETGSAIAIGHPHEATIEALNQWLGEIEARGLQLAPLSAVVRLRLGQSGAGG